MTENKIDPELADDRDVEENDIDEIELPEYDAAQFELDDNFEYVEEEEGDDNGDEDEA